MGRLTASMPFGNIGVVLVIHKFNPERPGLDDSKPFPDGFVKNLATSISFDHDFIILGDSLKNITVLTKEPKEAADKDKVRKPGDINLIKYTKSNLSVANVIAAFSMSRHLSCDRTDFARLIDAEG